MRKKLTAQTTAALLSIAMCLLLTPFANATTNKQNRVILSGSSWLGGNGVDIYANDGDFNSTSSDVNYVNIGTPSHPHMILSGYRWQCVELVNRLYLTKRWITGNWAGNGGDMFSTAPSNLAKEANGNITAVKPGDVISFGGGWGNYGHVAIVDHLTSVGPTKMTVWTISQNLSDTDDSTSATFTWDQTAKTINHWGSYTTNGLIQAPNDPSGSNLSAPTGASPIQNGGFNQDTSHWSVSGSANLAYNNASTTPNVYPYEGTGFAATNASQSGDSIAQTNNVAIGTYDTWCASVRVVTIGQNPGSGGTLALWLLGSSNDVSTTSFSNLAGANNWQEVKTCVMAMGARGQVKVQLYPSAGAPTIGVDAVDVHQTLNTSGGFNNGNGYWNLQPNTNLATYTVANAVGTSPYEGNAFAATNTSQPNGSFLQDMPRSISPGDTFCVDAEVITVGNATGASGALALYLTGANPTEQSVYSFDNLPGGNNWTHAKSCVTATAVHSNIRVQMYPAVNGPTLGVDALDVHASIIQNGGLNGTSSHWSPNGSLGYANYQYFSGTIPYEGSGFEVVQTNVANSSLSETRSYSWNAGDTFCAEAEVVTAGINPGGGGTLALWLFDQNSTNVSTYSFSALPSDNGWTRIKTCVMASGSTSNGTIKAEMYPSTNNLPLGIDAIDVH